MLLRFRSKNASGVPFAWFVKGVPQPANAAAWLMVTCTFVPLGRVAAIRSAGVRPPLPE